MPLTIYTIGHSTLSSEDFVATLKAHHVAQLVDIRTIAKSRHNPQFGEQQLAETLQKNDINYLRLENLGGLRRTVPDSINAAWRNKSFQGYADYMQTPEFWTGIDQLTQLAAQKPTAIMCAEVLPWRCHRSLVGDALLTKNIEVLDIMNQKTAKPHTLTSFAKVHDGKVYYPASALN